MKQRRHRLDARGKQSVSEPVVEVQAGRISRPATGGLDSRPGQRESVSPEPEVRHQLDVLRPQVVVIVGYITCVAISDDARLPAKRVPDRIAAPVLGDGAFNLIGSSRHTPREVCREPRELKIAHSGDGSGRCIRSLKHPARRRYRASASWSLARSTSHSSVGSITYHQSVALLAVRKPAGERTICGDEQNSGGPCGGSRFAARGHLQAR